MSRNYNGGGFADSEFARDFQENWEREKLQSTELSMLGTALHCPNCKCESKVKKVNAANMRHADPTETYTLECGHTVI